MLSVIGKPIHTPASDEHVDEFKTRIEHFLERHGNTNRPIEKITPSQPANNSSSNSQKQLDQTAQAKTASPIVDEPTMHGAPKILNKFSDDVNILHGSDQEVKAELANFLEQCNYKPTFLDIGGRFGEKKEAFAQGFDYMIMDIEDPGSPYPTIVGDICNCPEIESNQFDIVFSHSVFEHLNEPWNAAKECYRLTKKGGLLLHIAPFAWRYHPCPVDYFRFSSQGLELFNSAGDVKTLVSGYNIRQRRQDIRGFDIDGSGLDIPPIDEFGGWRENWFSLFIGQKLSD